MTVYSECGYHRSIGMVVYVPRWSKVAHLDRLFENFLPRGIGRIMYLLHRFRP